MKLVLRIMLVEQLMRCKVRKRLYDHEKGYKVMRDKKIAGL